MAITDEELYRFMTGADVPDELRKRIAAECQDPTSDVSLTLDAESKGTEIFLEAERKTDFRFHDPDDLADTEETAPFDPSQVPSNYGVQAMIWRREKYKEALRKLQ